MTLHEFKDGQFEHSDHSPKYGGTFFMAADYFHHIEGVMNSRAEFRIYIYDNFTKPLKGNHSAEASVSRAECKIGAVAMAMKLSDEGTYLTGALPPGFSRTFDVTARVRFGGVGEPALFNFSFPAVHSKQADDPATKPK